MPRPREGDFAPYYALYIDQAPGEDAVGTLRGQSPAAFRFWSSIGKEPGLDVSRPAPGKWTLREVLQHIMDTERVWQYRVLRFVRQDQTALPGFEQDDFVAAGRANERSLASLLEEYQSVRAASLTLLHSLNEQDLDRVGTASGARFTARALVFMMAGHEQHHMRLARERWPQLSD
jgi:uncharacterized damage-inducible protein DinB